MTALKTISLRIRQAKTELEDAGLETEHMANSVAELRAVMLATSGIDILEADGKTFRSTYDILDDLSRKWEELDEVSQASLEKLLAGTRQGNVFNALLSNFDTARKALESSTDSAGSAMAEHSKWLESLDAKINQLKGAYEALSNTVVGEDLFGGIIQSGTGLLKVLTWLIDYFGLLGVAFPVTAIVKLIKNFDKFREIGIQATSVTSKMTSQEVASILVRTKLDEATKKLVLTNMGLSAEQAEATLATASHSAANVGAISTTEALKVSTLSLKAACEGLKATLVADPIGIIAMAATIAIGGITLLKNILDKVRQSAIDGANDIIENYSNANDTFESNSKTLKNMRSEFEKLSKGVDENGNNISLTANEYDEFLSLIKQIVDISPDVCKGYDSEGKAVLNYKTALDDAIQSQENYIKNQRNIYLGKGRELFKGNKVKYSDAEKELLKASGSYSKYSLQATLNGGLSAFSPEKIDAYRNAFKELGITWRSGIDTFGASTESIMQMYENSDKLLVLLENSGAYTESELIQVEYALNGLASGYTNLKSVLAENADYLSEWSKDQTWYAEIPTDLLDTFASELENISVQSNDFSESLQNTAKYGNNFVKVISSNDFKGIVELSNGLKDGSVSIEEYNKAMSSFVSSFNGDANVLSAVSDYLYGLSNVSFEGQAEEFDAIAETTRKYKKEIDLLNKAYNEFATSGSVTSETYQEVCKAGEDFGDVFDISNGKIEISIDDLNKLVAQLTNEKGAILASNGATEEQIEQLAEWSASLRKLDKESKSILSSIDDLVDTYQKANEGVELNTLKTLSLVEKYPELASAIIETADGYKVEAEAVAELIKLKAQEYKINESLRLQSSRDALIKRSGNDLAYNNINTIFSDYKGWRGKNISSWSEFTNAWEHYFGTSASGDFYKEYRDYVELLIKESSSMDLIDKLADPENMKNLDKYGNSDKKSDDPAWLKNFKEQYDEWNHLVAIGKKTQDEYITWLDSAYKSAFANDTAGKYIADKWKYEEEVYKHYDEVRKTSLENTQKEFDTLIAQCESEYKVHQDETKYIDALTEALRKYDGVITDTQRKSVIEKLGVAKYDYYDNVIGDIEHEAKILERENGTEQKRIELYERAQKYLLEKKEAYLNDGYDATSTQLQKIETEYNSFADDIAKIMEDAFDKIIESQKESMENTVKSIDDSKEALNTVLDAVVAHIKRSKEAEIESLNDQKSEEKDAYDERKKEADEYYKDLIESAKSSSKAQVDSLEDQLKAYKDLIDARKELLQTAKDEEKYSRDVAEKNKGIAELQERIAVLSLDDSLSSKAERLKLEEELAKKQTELADFQSDYSLEKQLSALDAEYDAYAKAHDKNKELIESQSDFTIKEYEKQKEAKLEFLEEEYDAFIDNLDKQIEDINEYLKKEGNLRRDANALLLAEGETLWNTIMEYEYEYSEDITDLQNAWDVASGAMETYNDGQRDCLETIRKMVDVADELNRKLTAIEDMSYNSLVSEMKGNSAKWADSSPDERVRLHDANVLLAEKFNDATGTDALTYDKNKGKWMLGGIPLYHSGGIVGGGSLKDNEILAKLEKGEMVLTEKVKDSLFKNLSVKSSLIADNPYNVPIDVLREYSLDTVSIPNVINSSGLLANMPTGGFRIDNVEIDNSITVQGDLTKDTLPPLKKILEQSSEYTIRQLTDPLSRKGIGKSGMSLSI